MTTTTKALARRIADALIAEKPAILAAYLEEMGRKRRKGMDMTVHYDSVDRRMAKRYGDILAPHLID